MCSIKRKDGDMAMHYTLALWMLLYTSLVSLLTGIVKNSRFKINFRYVKGCLIGGYGNEEMSLISTSIVWLIGFVLKNGNQTHQLGKLQTQQLWWV